VLDQYVGRAWHRAASGRAAVLEQLETAVLPASASRTIEGDVLRIAFATDLAVRASVQAARAAHEQWITPLVPTEIEYGWTEG